MVPGYSLEQLSASSAKVDLYRAKRLDCGRHCLVRVVSADAQEREAFLRDAGLAAMIFDARLADIYESGTLPSGEVFVVEEDVEGRTSLRRQLIEAGVPDLLTSIRIVEQIAETLHILHTNGLTHGAVRPENVVIDHAPDDLPIVKLCNIDLGGVIARNTVANKFLIDSAIDAIRYFAPEQCSGQTDSPQTDVYSLGVVFYELLAGSPPFDAPKATALIDMHRSRRPPEITIDDFELRMLVTHSLSESLQKQPSFRQSSADLFARQMRHIEQLATHVSTPPPAVGAPAAPPRITPPPAAHGPAPVHVAIAEPEILDDCPNFEDKFNGSVYAPERVAVEFANAVDHEPLSVTDATFPPEPEPPQVEPTELPDHFAFESDLPERSSLAERRHSLKLWMRQTHPAQPVNNEATPDVPSTVTPDMIEVLPTAPGAAAFTPGVPEVIHSEPHVRPKLIEWEQPDDIPSPDEIEIEPAMAPGPALHIYVSSDVSAVQNPPSAPVTSGRHLIEWEQPEDDIPSIEDVIEARKDMDAPVVRAIQFKPEDSDVAAAVHERMEAEAKAPAPAPLAALKNDVHTVETNNFDFVPTLLGGSKERAKPETREQYSSIFRSYEPADSPRRSFPYRTLFVGLGLMTVAAILGLGGDPVWRYLSEPKTNEPVAAAAVPVPKLPLPARSDRTIDEEPPPPDSEPPSTFINSDPVIETPELSTPRQNAASPAPKPRKSVQTSSPVSAPPERADTTPFSPSTVVITYGSGNVRRIDSSKVRPNERSAPSGEPNRSGATRPRIVQVPPNH